MAEQLNNPLDSVANELFSRRTGMSFQRTRLSADRTLMSVIRTSLSLISFGFTIFQVFQKLKESAMLQGSAAPARHFGVALVSLGIRHAGLRHHLPCAIHARSSRTAKKYGCRRPDPWRKSFSNIVNPDHSNVILLIIGVVAIVNMLFHAWIFTIRRIFMAKSKPAQQKKTSRSSETAPPRKPNILVIWGNDIGISNLSCYSHGVMGYQTPNIDRIAKEGMMFTDSYGEQSCTAVQSSFIIGQSAYRTRYQK